jgi:hypothetical protein
MAVAFSLKAATRFLFLPCSLPRMACITNRAKMVVSESMAMVPTSLPGICS